VVRFGIDYILKNNAIKISKLIFRPELTYKYLWYSQKCFHEGTGGSSYDLMQLRSIKSHVIGLSAELAYRHCDSSEWDIPIEWFIGPGFLVAFEEKHLLGEGSGVCPSPEFDQKTRITKVYPSLRLGVRIGFRIFERNGN
jgi:hypothetical protein